MLLQENQNNIKETWKGILINVSKKSTKSINKLVDNGKEVTNPIEMADIINNLYVNIGKNVEEKIPKANKNFLHYLTNRNPFNIVLNPCTNGEIKNMSPIWQHQKQLVLTAFPQIY